MKYYITLCSFIVLIILSSTLSGCKTVQEDAGQKDYGVFLSLDATDLNQIAEYQTVVIDAQFFSREDIVYLKEQGCTVYSYLNIGSLEDFRDYYNIYVNLTMGVYENWEEERWVDVSSMEWQEFLVSLEEALLVKEIDGFFVDNCDVYYEYPADDIFEGLTKSLEHLMGYGKPVILNGGDRYVMEFKECYGDLQRIMTGVNQESVWSKIDFYTGEFVTQSKEDREYFEDYVEACSNAGLDVYILEYTRDDTLKQKIKTYCTEHQFYYYVSDSIELD